MMEYNNKRKLQIIKELIYVKQNSIKNIDGLLNTDNLSCEIKGSNNNSFHKPNNHTSFSKSLIKEILNADKELILQEIEDLKKQLEHLTKDDIYMSED